MLGSRNQMNVMSRGFGNTANGSLEAYGAEGEMNSYLNGVRHTSLRTLAGGHDGPKPNFRPKTAGQVMDSQEMSTKHGWAVVYVVKNRAGYYVVEHYCPKAKAHKTDGKYPTMDEAKTAANQIAEQLRSRGQVKGISGLNGYSSLGSYGPFRTSTFFVGVCAVFAYVGADMPGARPVAKQLAKTFNEPKSAVQSFMLIGGVSGIAYALYKEEVAPEEVAPKPNTEEAV